MDDDGCCADPISIIKTNAAKAATAAVRRFMVAPNGNAARGQLDFTLLLQVY
jgi:hypothetical protein